MVIGLCRRSGKVCLVMKKPDVQETDADNLDGLIHRLRQEGVEEGRREADGLVAKAESEARRILEAARKEADEKLAACEAGIERREAAARDALRRAARDVVIGLRSNLAGILERLVSRECGALLNSDALGELIVKAAADWAARAGEDRIEVLLNEADQRRLTETLIARFRDELKAEVELKVHSGVKQGFLIGAADNAMRFDFSDEALKEALCAFLNPRFASVFDELRAEEGKA